MNLVEGVREKEDESSGGSERGSERGKGRI